MNRPREPSGWWAATHCPASKSPRWHYFPNCDSGRSWCGFRKFRGHVPPLVEGVGIASLPAGAVLCKLCARSTARFRNADGTAAPMPEVLA